MTEQFDSSPSEMPGPAQPQLPRPPAGILNALRNLALLASRPADRAALLRAAVDALRATLPAADTAIFVRDSDTGHWQNAEPPLQAGHLPMCERTARMLSHHAAPIIIANLEVHNSPVSPLEGERGRALAALPCWSDQTLGGMIVSIHDHPYAFSVDEIASLELVALHLGQGLHLSTQGGDQASAARQLDILFHNTGDAVLITDESGCISQINPTARAMFKWTFDEVRCKPLHDLPFPSELRPMFDAAMQHPMGSQMAFDAQLADGRTLAVILASLDSESWPQTATLGRIMMVARDMTRLRDAEHARLNFIHSAAHDLRNPLGVTLVALSMLNKELQETGSAMQLEIISIGLRGIERIEKLINGLLHLEQIENEAGLSQMPVDVRDLVERAVIDTRPLFEARQQTFSLVLPDSLPMLTGNMYWLTRALVQVLTNAVQFTPPGGTVILRVTTQDEAIYLEVEDTGPGIPRDAQATVFDPFVYATHIDASPEPDGVGLGLAIVKSVIERHQGRVFVSSTPHVGSIFGIMLPINTE